MKANLTDRLAHVKFGLALEQENDRPDDSWSVGYLTGQKSLLQDLLKEIERDRDEAIAASLTSGKFNL